MIWWRGLGTRWGRIAAITLALVLLGTLVAQDTAPVVHAHAALIRSSPENGAQERRPPARVFLYFSESVEAKLTEIKVFDVDRNQVDEGDTLVDEKDRTVGSVGVPTLDPGLYTVEFANVSSVDGHPWTGIIQFIVLNPDGSVPPNATFDPEAGAEAGSTGLLPKNLDAALKWMALLALATAVGSALFVALVVRPAASFLDEEDHKAAVDAGDTWVITIAHVLLPVSFIASALLVVLAVNRFETSTSIFEYLTTVHTGRYQLANLVLVALALVAADVLYLSGNRRIRQVAMAALILACGGAMLTYSLISHGATGEGRYWSEASDFIHFAASSVWLGALVLLIPLLRFRHSRFADDPVGFLYVANAFDRFSVVAGLSVFTVLTSGVFNGLVQMPEWSAFTDTTYGRVLLAKLIIVGLLLPVAGLNAFILKPRLVAAIDGLYQQGGASSEDRRASWSRHLAWLQRAFPVTIAAEVVLVVGVFASVGVLTQTSTAKGEIAQKEAIKAASTEFVDVKDAGDLQLGIEVQPNKVGINRYALTIRNADGSPATDVTQARFRFTYTDPSRPDVEQPTAELLLRATTNPGVYEGQGSYFTQVGSWQAEAGIRRAGKDDVARTFIISVAPSESAAKEAGGPFALPFDSFTWNIVLGALLAVSGVMLLLYREQFRPLAAQGYRIGVTVATALILGGAVLWFGVHPHKTVADPSAGNPVKATADSIEKGRLLFQQNCVTCHGAEGRGDGAQAASLNPAPADFRQHLPYHTDPQFFAFVAGGFPGSAMPAFREQFSDEDIWNLVNFMRTFENVAQQ
ncbi:MAG: CopD family protein [Chloroflexi bacterium]|nr:CopD family protein [Chloroflexota bacterium]